MEDDSIYTTALREGLAWYSLKGIWPTIKEVRQKYNFLVEDHFSHSLKPSICKSDAETIETINSFIIKERQAIEGLMQRSNLDVSREKITALGCFIVTGDYKYLADVFEQHLSIDSNQIMHIPLSSTISEIRKFRNDCLKTFPNYKNKNKANSVILKKHILIFAAYLRFLKGDTQINASKNLNIHREGLVVEELWGYGYDEICFEDIEEVIKNARNIVRNKYRKKSSSIFIKQSLLSLRN